MRYIINSVSAYSDSAIPKLGFDTSAYSDDGAHLLTRLIVIPLDVVKKTYDLKQASASLLAIVEKFAQSHAEMNLTNLERLDTIRLAKDAAEVMADMFAQQIEDAIVIEKPELIKKADYKVELLPIKVNPPVIIDEPIEKVVTK